MKLKWLRSFWTGCALLILLSIVAATLRGRPDVRLPNRLKSSTQDTSFQATLLEANQHIATMVADAQLQSAARADNLAIARRISLALVGSGLSLEEIRALERVPEADQIQWWTDYLLRDRRWADYFAERFSRIFVGTHNGPFLLFRRRKFNAWLADQFEQGVSYDQIVRAMISAEGLWTDTPPVNFVTATMDEGDRARGDPVRLAGRTSRAFLAQRLDCMQCHDDFLGNVNFGSSEERVGGTQEHFHSLAAFYAGTSIPQGPFSGIVEDRKSYEFEFLGETEKRLVEPQVPFSRELLESEGKPRQRLANWVTHEDNRAFSRATVNRVWALMLSRPLVMPVDSIPLDESVPPVLDVLARDFSEHEFDLRRLIRLIIATDAFQRDSRADFDVTDAHEAAWAVFPVTQLRPEQVAGSMFQACKLTAIDASSSIFTRLKTFGDGQNFVRNFGDRGEDEFDSDSVTISQRLILMNGNLIGERTKADLVNNAATRIGTLVNDDQTAVQLTFLATLNRLPKASENAIFAEHLEEKRGDARSRALGDLYWAIMNSTEFSWNH